jgi:hypothetical protein
MDLIVDATLLIFTDIILVIGAVVAGYVFSVVQHGFGPSSSEKVYDVPYYRFQLTIQVQFSFWNRFA